MKIERINFHALRNHEHFQYQKELNTLFNQFDTAMLKIKHLADKHYLLFVNEDEALMKITKNTFSKTKTEVDAERDRIYRGLVDTIKAATNHYHLPLRDNATRIQIPIKTYGNVSILPLNEETSAIYNLANELRDNFLEDVDALQLHPWIDELEACNIRYEESVQNSNNEELSKTELKMKEVRVEMDTLVRQLFDRVEALLLIEENVIYIEFIKPLNKITEKYKLSIAQRQGRNAAKDN